MMTEDYDYIMVFTSHYRAIYIYDRLIRRNLEVKLVTAPNTINISCTQAVRFKGMDMEIIKQEVRKDNIYPTAIYRIVKVDRKVSYELVE
jgi:hypothetical protein